MQILPHRNDVSDVRRDFDAAGSSGETPLVRVVGTGEHSSDRMLIRAIDRHSSFGQNNRRRAQSRANSLAIA